MVIFLWKNKKPSFSIRSASLKIKRGDRTLFQIHYKINCSTVTKSLFGKYGVKNLVAKLKRQIASMAYLMTILLLTDLQTSLLVRVNQKMETLQNPTQKMQYFSRDL